MAGTMTGTLAAATRTGGYVLVYGSLGATDVTVALKDLQYRSVTIKGFWCGPRLRRVKHQHGVLLAWKRRLSSASDSLGDALRLGRLSQG